MFGSNYNYSSLNRSCRITNCNEEYYCECLLNTLQEGLMAHQINCNLDALRNLTIAVTSRELFFKNVTQFFNVRLEFYDTEFYAVDMTYDRLVDIHSSPWMIFGSSNRIIKMMKKDHYTFIGISCPRLCPPRIKDNRINLDIGVDIFKITNDSPNNNPKKETTPSNSISQNQLSNNDEEIRLTNNKKNVVKKKYRTYKKNKPLSKRNRQDNYCPKHKQPIIVPSQ